MKILLYSMNFTPELVGIGKYWARWPSGCMPRATRSG